MVKLACLLLVLLPFAISQGGVVTNLGCDLQINKGLAWLRDSVPFETNEIFLREEANICQPEWGTYKTCCPSEKVKNFVGKILIS